MFDIQNFADGGHHDQELLSSVRQYEVRQTMSVKPRVTQGRYNFHRIFGFEGNKHQPSRAQIHDRQDIVEPLGRDLSWGIQVNGDGIEGLR